MNKENKIYKLQQDSENFANFYQEREKLEDSFSSIYWEWVHIDLATYKPVVLKLSRADNGSKNYKTDICTAIAGNLIIFSEKAINVLKDILEEKGQIIPVITESKRKKFYGFYPNKQVYPDSIINFDKSDWHQAEKGKIIYSIVFNNTYPKNDYLFTVFSSRMTCFVTEKFKKLVEDNNLQGFDFSKIIPVSD